VAQLVGEHRHRGVRVLDRERPAEPAALLSLVDLDEVDPLDRTQQPQRAVADLEQPQRMAGRVVGDAVRERGADVLDSSTSTRNSVSSKTRSATAGQCSRTVATHEADGDTTCSASSNTRSKRRASAVPCSA
jgi:hypothetical protein